MEMEMAACKALFLINIASCINLPVDGKGAPDKSYSLDESCSTPSLMKAAEDLIVNTLEENAKAKPRAKGTGPPGKGREGGSPTKGDAAGNKGGGGGGEGGEEDARCNLYDPEGCLLIECELLLQYARMKRHVCEPKAAIGRVKEAASILKGMYEAERTKRLPYDASLYRNPYVIREEDNGAEVPDDPKKSGREGGGWLELHHNAAAELGLECMLVLMQCYGDLGNTEEAMDLCADLSAEAFGMKAYNVLVVSGS